ncbi:50S ribosomal protein L20 [Candidatus Saccharibacteria bacterium]|nr:50S ribosomal protein L20 [Candidatus Saccharibacteria bacterium]
MRVKKGVTAHNRHKKVRKATKGMIKSRRSSYRLGKQALIRALQYAYRDRRTRKRAMRQLWTIRINAAAREHGIKYSEFIAKLQKSKIELNRKSLAELAVHEPQAFSAVVKSLK